MDIFNPKQNIIHYLIVIIQLYRIHIHFNKVNTEKYSVKQIKRLNLH